ncbi:hypothetical protein DKM44_12785 [Deinococcus irradiatisoli]|uniref:Right handed beta helix domain-containing protein n=1 Tax=Deinococcus irradiatisoli TaxID=2202254 RepID=A0A2Z3JFN3_9DEIO|nr:right-handed parallel beta-helix repeat-containing protein [Deinococcus irradiatisoli]AWN23997.1 hypothetical protein DKM44_12785 [Deinococcus irradiatisoli]
MRVTYPAAYRVGAQLAGGQYEGRAVLGDDAPWAELQDLEGNPMKFYGGEVGDKLPPLITIRVTPEGAGIVGVPVIYAGNPRDTSTDGSGVWDLSPIGESGPTLATEAQIASLSSLLDTGATLLPQMQQGVTDVDQVTTEAFGVLGINPAYVSDTTADPAGSPPDGTRGAKRDLSGNLVRLFRAGGAWIASGGALLATLASLSAGSLPSRTVYLEPTTLSLPSGVALPDGITFVCQPGKTIIECAGGSGVWLNVPNGKSAVFKDALLDGKNLISTGILANGNVRFEGGGIVNIQGTSTVSAYGIQQGSASTYAVVKGAQFSGYSGYEDGVIGNSIGAHRALLFQGTGGKVDDCDFYGIGGFEDGDAVQFQTSTDASLVWTPARGKVLNSRFWDIKKRAIKAQASDVEIRGCFFGSTNLDPNTAVFAAVNIFGSRCKVSDNQFELPLAGAAIQVESGANDTLIQGNGINASVGSSETLVRGSSLKAILNIGNRTRITGNSINTAGIAVYLHGLSTYAQVSGNPLIRGGAACVLADTNTVGHTITHNTIGGTATQQLPTGTQLAGGSQRCIVMHNRYQYVTDGTRVLTTATGHLVSQNIKGPGVVTLLNTFGMASDAYDTNQFSDAATLRAQSGSTLTAPAVFMPSNQYPTPYNMFDWSDVLAFVAKRLGGTGASGYAASVNAGATLGDGAAISATTALTPTGHNGLQSTLSLNTAQLSTLNSVVWEFSWGTSSAPLTFTGEYIPEVLFQAIPTNLTQIKIEYDTGSGYVTAYTQDITPAYLISLPAITPGAAIKKIRYTLLWTVRPTSLAIRRFMLKYGQIWPTQYLHPTWDIFALRHYGDGSHAYLSGTLTTDVASIAAGSYVDLSITVSGSALLDVVNVVTPPPAGIIQQPWVSAAGTVTLRLFNHTAAAIDPASQAYTVKILR